MELAFGLHVLYVGCTPLGKGLQGLSCRIIRVLKVSGATMLSSAVAAVILMVPRSKQLILKAGGSSCAILTSHMSFSRHSHICRCRWLRQRLFRIRMTSSLSEDSLMLEKMGEWHHLHPCCHRHSLEVLGDGGKAGFLSFLQSELQAGPTSQTET